MNKYNAKKVVIDGITFDSIKESERYLELKRLQEKNKITELRVHPSFILQEAFKCRGKKYFEIKYVADFIYHDIESGNNIVEDVKGLKTDVYKLKSKIFLKQYGEEFTFKEV